MKSCLMIDELDCDDGVKKKKARNKFEKLENKKKIKDKKSQ